MGSLPLILAQAGSGSGGFGGGGGGGGGGFGGGSSGSGEGDPLVAVVVFGLFGIFLLYLAIHTVRYRRKLRERDRAVRTASAEAAEDDAYFASDELERHAVALFRAAQTAWDARDREGLARLVGPDLLVEWKRRLDDFDQKGWHNRVEVMGDPNVLYVGITNREDDDEDRAVVRIEAKLRAFVEDRAGMRVMRKGEKDELVTLVEYWTLARSNGAWMVRRASRPPTSPSSTSTATRGPTLSTCRWRTPASPPPCSRRPPGARSRRGPRPWTATTPRSSGSRRRRRSRGCSTPATPRAPRVSSCAARA
jgi:hypothetical protein